MQFERRFVVQDRDSRMFLGQGEDADIDFVPFINRAFLFEDDESAALTGHAMCDSGGFLIFRMYIVYGEDGRVV